MCNIDRALVGDVVLLAKCQAVEQPIVKKISADVPSVLILSYHRRDRSAYNIENRKLTGLREKIEQEYSSRYNPDPDPSGKSSSSLWCLIVFQHVF